jgi:hypothetical protein
VKREEKPRMEFPSFSSNQSLASFVPKTEVNFSTVLKYQKETGSLPTLNFRSPAPRNSQSDQQTSNKIFNSSNNDSFSQASSQEGISKEIGEDTRFLQNFDSYSSTENTSFSQFSQFNTMNTTISDNEQSNFYTRNYSYDQFRSNQTLKDAQIEVGYSKDPQFKNALYLTLDSSRICQFGLGEKRGAKKSNKQLNLEEVIISWNLCLELLYKCSVVGKDRYQTNPRKCDFERFDSLISRIKKLCFEKIRGKLGKWLIEKIDDMMTLDFEDSEKIERMENFERNRKVLKLKQKVLNLNPSIKQEVDQNGKESNVADIVKLEMKGKMKIEEYEQTKKEE